MKKECGACVNCKGKKRHGGDGSNHKRCIERFCLEYDLVGQQRKKGSSESKQAPEQVVQTSLVVAAASAEPLSRQRLVREANVAGVFALQAPPMAPPPKRGPGRPRKHPVPPTNTTEAAAAQLHHQQQRPRANTTNLFSLPVSSVARPKRGPGRPRKLSTVTATNDKNTAAQQPRGQSALATAPKRGPGRPRKHPVAATTNNSKMVSQPHGRSVLAATANQSSAAPLQTKRGPGRPRKHPLGETNDNTVVAIPLPTKRRRGRPKKGTPTETDINDYDCEAPLAKRPRGRPKKRSPTETDDNNYEYEAPPLAKRPRGRPRKNDSKPNSGRRVGCGSCVACMRVECGECVRCLGKTKFGGDGCDKQVCLQRRCHELYPQQKRIDEANESRGKKKSSAQFKKQSKKRTKKSQESEDSMHDEDSAATAQSSNAITSTVITLTNYLSQHASEKENSPTQPSATTLYGIEVPQEPAAGICFGCKGARDSELQGQPILLCDGQDCDREHHLSCCVPCLREVPTSEHWYCQECSLAGSTSALIKYLEDADEEKEEFMDDAFGLQRSTNKQYIQYLLRKDSIEAKLPIDSRIPKSELHRSAATLALALNDDDASYKENAIHGALPAFYFLGKPIRLYNPISNQYHTGRIVDFRFKSASDCMAAVVHDATSVNDAEFLVRFAAGKDGRKKPYHHWINLEEHALAVGSEPVWARMPTTKDWTPAILWFRTARELVPTQHLLDESEKEVVFESNEKRTVADDRTNLKAYARTFGAPPQFGHVNVTDQCMGLNDARNQSDEQCLDSPLTVLQLQMARAEEAEQQRVGSWHNLPQCGPAGPAMFSCRDTNSLPAAVPVDRERHAETRRLRRHALLCPSLSLGLDRSKILRKLKVRCIPATKNVATTLSCEVVAVNSKTIKATEISSGLNLMSTSRQPS